MAHGTLVVDDQDQRHGVDPVAVVDLAVGVRLDLDHGHLRTLERTSTGEDAVAGLAGRAGEHGDQPGCARSGEVATSNLVGDRPAGSHGTAVGAPLEEGGGHPGGGGDAEEEQEPVHGSVDGGAVLDRGVTGFGDLAGPG